MKCLIINTLPEFDDKSTSVIGLLSEAAEETEVFDINNYEIGSCTGCSDCWFKTPGVCTVTDDWELLFKKILKSDCVIFITEALLGFVSHRMKNIVDRLKPLSLPYTKLHKGETRYMNRYEKCWNVGLLYSGNAEKEYLNEWMERFSLNFFWKSLGAYSFEENGELCREIGNI